MKSTVSSTPTSRILVIPAYHVSYFLLTLVLGFQHTAFSLLNEGHLQHSVHLEKQIPRGELIELLIKALLYTEVEAHWRGNNDMIGNCTTGFSLLETHVCSLNPNLKPTVNLSASSASIPAMMAAQSVTASERSDSQKRKASTPVVEESHVDKRQRTAEFDNVDVEEKNPDGASASFYCTIWFLCLTRECQCLREDLVCGERTARMSIQAKKVRNASSPPNPSHPRHRCLCQ
jgi:hypothetical protein